MAKRQKNWRDAAGASDALEALDCSLKLMKDRRRPQGRRYPLRSVVLTSLMAMVCGCDDAEAIDAWGEANEDWLETILELPHGAPSQDVVLNVFAALHAEEFQSVFRNWVTFLRARLGESGGAGHIAIDGKTSRGSRLGEQPGIHTVSAWLSDAQLVLGQKKVRAKSNEIKAIPELLQLLDLKGSTVTIDAIGCQTVIAQAIVERGGDYLLAVKENHPALRAEIAETFADALNDAPRPHDRPAPPDLAVHEEHDKGHGRIEHRTMRVCHDLSRISGAQRWQRLAFVVMVERSRTDIATDKHSHEVAYYIGSGSGAPTARLAQIIRSHWAIENGLHWCLDVAFHEDHARHRKGNLAANFTTLRHFALSLLKAESTNKLGIANKRKIAGWNHDYLLTVLTGPPVE